MTGKHIILILTLVTTTAACTKRKFQTIDGTLLLCRTIPQPIANKQVEVYQSGVSGYIFSGGDASLASGNTDNTGHFNIRFKPGKVDYLFGSGPNENPLLLRSAEKDTSFPRFWRNNFKAADYAGKPIYIGKLIDTLIIHLQFAVELLPSDTIEVYVPTLGRVASKLYWGLSVTTRTEMLLDTFYQAFSTSFDETKQQYGTPVTLAKRSLTPAGNVYRSSFYPYPEMLGPADEKRVAITYYWNR